MNRESSASTVRRQRTTAGLALLSAVWNHAPVARSKISELTGLAPSSVTRLVRQLVDDGLLVEAHASKSTGGRPAMLLSLSDDAGAVLAIDLSGVDIRAAIITPNGRRLATRELAFDGHGQDAVLRQVGQIAAELSKQANGLEVALLGIGVSVPGTVDCRSGTIVDVSHLDLKGVALGPWLSRQLGLEVYLEHDTVAAAYAEKHAGAGRRADHLIFITVGGGIGAGLVLEDRIYRGEAGGAGEIGHVVVEFDGPECVCGKRGCLEAVASATALIRAAETAVIDGKSVGLRQRSVSTGESLSVLDIVEVASHGDAEAIRLLDLEADYLARAIGTVTSLLDIRLVIIGGEDALLTNAVLQRVSAALPRYQLYSHRVDIVRAELGQDAALQGVAALALRSFFGLTGFKGPAELASQLVD